MKWLEMLDASSVWHKLVITAALVRNTFAYNVVPDTKESTLKEIEALWQETRGLRSGTRGDTADTLDRAA
jgi:hypothetical protein